MVNSFFPSTLAEALEIRAKEKVIPYAGGTDLMVMNLPHPSYLFIGQLEELKVLEVKDGRLHIGAAVTFTQALNSGLLPSLLRDAVSGIASPAIRNAGTFGGNLGNGSAVADSVLIEYAADALIRVQSLHGERLLPVDQFILGRKQLDLRSDELITEIILPLVGLEDYAYQKIGGRKSLAISYVSFAGILNQKDGVITRFSVAFGAVAPTVLRYKEIEQRLIGKTIPEAQSVKDEIIAAYRGKLILPEQRVSAAYGQTVCLNLLRDFLNRFVVPN